MNSISTHAPAAREAKRKEAAVLGMDDQFVSDLVERFYQSVQQDSLLGPIFSERINDWPAHLGQMKRFWRSVLFGSGEFFGSPMAKHVAIPDLERHHFVRWLALFGETLEQLGSRPAYDQVIVKARTIATSLLNGIRIHRDGTLGLTADEAFT